MTNELEKPLNGPEQNVNAAESSREQLEQLAHTHEQLHERSIENGEKSAATARQEALEVAVSVEAGGAERQSAEPLAIKRRGPISKKERDTSFKNTMEEVQHKMTPTSRTFSKLIHLQPIEKASDIVGKTIARPNAILSGAIVAFALTLSLYLLAKNYGYPLSGFESIGAFILGWFIGAIFDYLKVLVTGKK